MTLVLKQTVHFQKDGLQTVLAGTPKDEVPEEWRKELSGDHLWKETDETDEAGPAVASGDPTGRESSPVESPQLGLLRSENEELRSKVEQLQSRVDETGHLDSEVHTLRSENEDLKSRVAELEAAADEAAESSTDDKSESAPVDYDELHVPDLKALAKERDIEIPSGANKPEIIDALKAADEAAEQQ